MVDICPECGGTDAEGISPGLLRCASQIAYTEMMMVFEPGVVQHPAYRTSYRLCGNTFEVDTPMTNVVCQIHPERSSCGAFATGSCSECGRYACRYHSRFYSDRLMCSPCADRTQSADAAERERRQREADEARAAVERAEAAAEAEQHAAWERHPLMSRQELVRWLSGPRGVRWVNGKYPLADGYRLPSPPLSDLPALVRETGIPPQPVAGPSRYVFGMSFRTSAGAWPIGTYVHDFGRYDSHDEQLIYLGIREATGNVCGIYYFEAEKSFRTIDLPYSDGPTWTGSARELDQMRRLLREPLRG